MFATFRIAILFLCVLLISNAICFGQDKLKAGKSLLKTIDRNFVDAANQYKVVMKSLQPGRFPKTYHADDELERSGSDWWWRYKQWFK